jgi:recombination protein RecT
MNTATALVAFSKDFAAYEKPFASVLPAHIPAKKFMRTVVGAMQNNPAILECDRNTIYAACQKAAQDGLILDGREAALVKFKTACQYMPMVYGILKKLRNSGLVSTVRAETVHEKDSFSYNPAMEDVLFRSGRGRKRENLEQLEKVRKISRAGNDEKGKPKGIWKQWPEEMAKKSVLRRIAKYLPSSADLDQVFQHDNENYDLDITEPTLINKSKKRTRASKIIDADSSEVAEDDLPLEEDGDDPI